MLFSYPPPTDLEDAQQEKKLVFFLKQFECGLSLPLSRFFVEVFQFYGVSPRVLTPNSILFMYAFEAIC